MSARAPAVNGGSLVKFAPIMHLPLCFRRHVSFPHSSTRLLCRLVLLSLLPALASAGPLQDDLKARRAKAMERLGTETLAIFWSAPTRVFSADVDYEYRQDSDMLYLTGIDQEETILVLMPGN